MIDNLTWRKARACGNGACVEVAAGPDVVRMRDGKLGDGSPILTFDRRMWEVFVDGLDDGGEGGN